MYIYIYEVLKMFKKCNLCKKRIVFNLKEQVIMSKDIAALEYYHKECYLQTVIDKLAEQLQDVSLDLKNYRRLTTNMLRKELFDYQNKCSKKVNQLFISEEFYSQLYKDLSLQRDLVYKYTPEREVITNLWGMDIIVDNSITGWYIK
jgi:hypothetical protein